MISVFIFMELYVYSVWEVGVKLYMWGMLGYQFDAYNITPYIPCITEQVFQMLELHWTNNNW